MLKKSIVKCEGDYSVLLGSEHVSHILVSTHWRGSLIRGVYVLKVCHWNRERPNPSLVPSNDGTGIVDRNQKTQEGWHSYPQILERHKKDVGLILSKEHSQGFLSL